MDTIQKEASYANVATHANVQSGLVAPKTYSMSKEKARELREVHQRVCRAAKDKALRKLVPKRDRSRDRKVAREAKMWSTIDQSNSAEEQGFGPIGVNIACSAAAVAFGQIARLASRTKSAVSNFDDTMHVVRKSLLDFVADCKKKVGNLWRVFFVALIWFITTKLPLPKLVKGLLSGVYIAILGENLWGVISPYFNNDAEEQSGLTSSLSKLLTTTFLFIHLPAKGASALSEIMKRMTLFSRVSEGMEDLFKFCLELIEHCVNFVRSKTGKDAVAFGDSTTRAVKDFVKRSEVIEMKLATTTNPEHAFLADAIKCAQDGYALRLIVQDEKLKVSLVKAIERLEIKLSNFQSSVTQLNSFRVEPVFVLLAGPPKVGKTTMVTTLASSVLIASGLCTSEDAVGNIWQKGDSKYWESYHGQKCVVMDDCFQEKLVPGADTSEFMQIIRQVGNWLCPLNMANANLKAKFFFNSNLMIGTTNAKHLTDTDAHEVIKHTDAVVRRIHRPYWVEVREEFTCEANGTVGMDYDKLNREIARGRELLLERMKAGVKVTQRDVISSYPWHVWRVRKITDYSGGVAFPGNLGAEVSLEQVVIDIADELKEKARVHEMAHASLEDYNDLLHKAERNETSEISVAQSDLVLIDAPVEVPHMEQRAPVPDPCDVAEERLSRRYAQRERYAFYKRFYEEVQAAEQRENTLRGKFNALRDHILDNIRKSELASSLFTFSKNAFRFAISFCVGIALVKVVTGFADAVLAVVRMIMGDNKPTEQSNLPKNEVRKKKEASPILTHKFQAVAQAFDCDQMSIRQQKIYENGYKLYWTAGNRCIGQVTMVSGTIAMMPAHFFTQIKEVIVDDTSVTDEKLLFVSCSGNGSHQVAMTARAFLKCRCVFAEEADLAFVEMPRELFQAAKNVSKYFLSEDDINDYVRKKVAVQLDVCQLLHPKTEPIAASRQTFFSPTMELQTSLVVSGKVRNNLIRYEAHTKAGMCGAPLCVTDPRAKDGKCFLGIHIAGKDGVFRYYGFAVPVSAECVEAAVRALGSRIVDKSQEDFEARGVPIHPISADEQSQLYADGLLGGSFLPFGKVEKGVAIAPISKLQKTPVGYEEPFGKLGQRPAHLRSTTDVEGVVRHPMVEGLRKYQSPVEQGDFEDLRTAVDMATRPFEEQTVNEPRFILSFEEAVVGLEGLKLKAVNRSTSSGYPYVLEVKSGKKDFFGSDEVYTFESIQCVDLKERVHHIVEEARQGNRLGHICVDFLKDELRPNAKVDTVQTRVISGSPLDLVLAVRMLFGSFVAACFRHNTSTGLCPGINPYTEWWRVVAQVTGGDVHANVFDGDFSRFDASEQPQILWAILDFINRWYDDCEENQLAREVLWLDLVHSRHLTGTQGCEFVVQWNKCLPSGHPLTTIVNSFYSLIAISVCYVDLVGNTNMWQHAGVATYGDDNLIGVSDEIKDVFNQVTIAEAMKRLLNLTFTSGSKDGTLVPYKTIEECTFLKRGFRMDCDERGGGWSAPLEKSSFMFTSYYHKGKMTREHLENKLEASLGELCLHPESAWEIEGKQIFAFMRENGIVPSSTSREEFRKKTFSKKDFWY